MDRLVGLVLVTAALLSLLWLYDAFPEQRSLLIFGSIIGATITTRRTRAQGDQT